MQKTNRVRPIIIQGHERPLTMVKYNREGDLLFTAAKDHRPCLWYADNGERIGTYEGHTGTVWCIDVNCACPLLERSWRRFHVPALSANRPYRRASLGSMHLAHLLPPIFLSLTSRVSSSVPHADDSTRLLTGSADNQCKLWDVRTGECLHTWKHTGPVRDVRFALGEKAFLTVLDNIMGNQPTIFVWDLDLKDLANTPDAPKTKMLGHTAKVHRALWGPVNRSIFSGSDDATLRVWNPETGEQKGIVEGVHQKKITDLQLSWDMTLLVTSCGDHWVRLFETSTLTLLKAFNTERNINSAAVSPLSTCPYLIAAGGQDAMSVTTTSSKQGNFHCSFFDHVFDDELGAVHGHFGPVNTLAFAPHGRAYTSGGEEGYVRIHHLPPDYFEAFDKKVAEAQGKNWP